MIGLVPIGTALLGAGAGLCVGAWLNDLEGGSDDLGIGMMIYGMFGALIGGFVGVIVGSLLVAFVL
jgi:hypothetical protein